MTGREASSTDVPFAIRAATSSDAATIGVLCTQVYLDTYATDGIRPLLVREVASHFALDAVRTMLAGFRTRCLVVEREHHLIGFAQVAVDAAHADVPATRPAELERLYVLGRFAGRGVGSALLAAGEAVAVEAGATTMWLGAWVFNERALAFYARHGYRDVGSDWYVFEDERHENRLFRKELERSTEDPRA